MRTSVAILASASCEPSLGNHAFTIANIGGRLGADRGSTVPRARDPFRHALDEIRVRLECGEFQPGAAVVITDAARRLGVSTTPVREALARLAGEGLVEDGPNGGYVVPRLGAGDIRERYALHHLYVRAALDAQGPPSRKISTSDETLPVREASPLCAEALFDRIVLALGDRMLGDAYSRVRRQLRLIRRVESVVLENDVEEIIQLHQILDYGSPVDLAAGVETYHQRRYSAAGGLLAAMSQRG